MKKQFLTGENKTQKKPQRQQKSISVQPNKITSFFRVESVVKSTSRNAFKSVEAYEEIPNDFEKKMIDENDERSISHNSEKYSVMENSNNIYISDPSDREMKRREIQEKLKVLDEHDTETDSDIEIENEEQFLARQQQELREAKLKLENVYQLPYYFKNTWVQKARILEEIANKKHIKRHEFYTQLTLLIKLANVGTTTVNLDSLKQFATGYLKDNSTSFFESLIPFIAKLALEIVTLDDVPILMPNQEGKITLTKRQAATFVANMFFCTLASQRARNLPYGNSFKAMFAGSYNYNQSDRKIEKLICIYNYFLAVKEAIETRPGEYESQKVTYQRLVYNDKDHSNSQISNFWRKSQSPLTQVVHEKNGSIEDYDETIHVDFANAYIGGGVLDHGLVQEEIRFLISPELIISRLFAPKMEDTEAIIILGSEKYTIYSGYGDTFHCEGRADQSDLKLDSQNRKLTAVLAIDAIHYGQSYDSNIQYRMVTIIREILKAYIGFQAGDEVIEAETALGNNKKYKISTGRWGCGIFMGDPQLKFFIQWIAASQAQRDMIFCSFKDKELSDLDDIIELLQDKSVSDIFNIIHKYTEYFKSKSSSRDKSIFSLFQYCQIYVEEKQKTMQKQQSSD